MSQASLPKQALPKNANEVVAEALFMNRYAKTNGPWSRFVSTHPDIAEIFRENAAAALRAVNKLLTESVGAA